MKYADGVKRRLSVTRLRRQIKRWAVRDRAWVGRLASRLGTVRVEECRFRIDSPLISDHLKSRLLYGRYERTERELLRRHLNARLPVVELGGGMGVVACIVNRRLTHPRNHVVVEANATILPLLASNRQLNAAGFETVHAAIAYDGPDASLQAGPDLLGSQIGPAEGHKVSAIRLGALLERVGFDTCTLICDIEGAELELVAREIETLRSRVALIVIEEHPEYCDPPSRALMFARLAEAGFDRIDALRKVHVLRNLAVQTRER